MALNETLKDSRAYLAGWLSIVDIVDSVTGRIFHHRFNTSSEPSSGELDTLIAAAKLGDQAELDYDANSMNLTRDEERAIEYLRNIKRDIIIQIRAFPGVTLAQAQSYVDTNYPNSIVNFTRLYQFYLNLLNLSTWDEFKTWIIDHKFREVD